MGCSPWGRWESGTTERLHFHFSLSCIGEGNGNPLQCSCLENPRDGGAWWAAVYGVAQSLTRLKRLSSSSSSELQYLFTALLFSIPFMQLLLLSDTVRDLKGRVLPHLLFFVFSPRIYFTTRWRHVSEKHCSNWSWNFFNVNSVALSPVMG